MVGNHKTKGACRVSALHRPGYSRRVGTLGALALLLSITLGVSAQVIESPSWSVSIMPSAHLCLDSATNWQITPMASDCLTGAVAGGGLTISGTNIGLITTCSSNQVLQWNGSAWACATISGSVGGSGTVGTIPLWVTNTTTLGNSEIADNGTGTITIGSAAINGILITNIPDAGHGQNIEINPSGNGTGYGGNIVLLSGPAGTSSNQGLIQLLTNVAVSGGHSGAIELDARALGGTPALWTSYDDYNSSGLEFTGISGGGANGTAYLWSGSGVPSFNCSSPHNFVPSVYFNASASTASTVIYVCVSGTTWNALTVP